MHDIGTYLALAENEAGRDQTHCMVAIQQMPSIDQTPIVNPDAFKYLEAPSKHKPRDDSAGDMKPPKVIVPLSNVKLKESQPMFLACKIEGYPKPTVIK